MLKSLRVKDFALIKSADLEFTPELNLITGETGAGKSLLLGALGTLLGSRADTDVIRRNADKAVIEGEFYLSEDSPAWEALAELELPQSDSITVRREINLNGRNRIFINDSLTTVKKLSEIADFLVDLCGQHEQTTLLRNEYHLEYLDRFAGLLTERDEFRSFYNHYQKLKAQLSKLQNERSRNIDRAEIIEFQIKEIERSNPQLEEEGNLLAEEKALQHGEQILEICHRAEEEIMTEPDSALERIEEIAKELGKVAVFALELKVPFEDISNAAATLEEAVRNIVTIRENFDFSQERLDSVRDRLGELSQLKRKYGGSLEAVLQRLEELKSEENSISRIDAEIVEVTGKLKEIRQELSTKASTLSRQRLEAVPDLKKAMGTILKDLGFKYVSFEARLSKKSGDEIPFEGRNYALLPEGIDTCEIYISTNTGEPVKPLKDVASGGEISRILLALKSVIAGKDKPGTLIFDEIDIGISGRIARKVGIKLWEIAKNQQVLVITHLPQIASVPGKHFAAVKVEDGNTAISEFIPLNEDERIAEVSKLLSAGEPSGHPTELAKELLAFGKSGDLSGK